MRNHVREARNRRGWSQAELAKELGVSRQAINAIENGRSVPSLDSALKFAAVFSMSVEQLFSLDSEDAPLERPAQLEPPAPLQPRAPAKSLERGAQGAGT